MNDSRLAQEDLEVLIERYFEAETSECEEVLLKKHLMYGKYKLTPAVKDALAVMSLSARCATCKSSHSVIRNVMGIAASLAIVLSVSMHLDSVADTGVCEMYVAGVHVSDRASVMAKMQADLREASDACDSSRGVVESQLSEFLHLVGEHGN